MATRYDAADVPPPVAPAISTTCVSVSASPSSGSIGRVIVASREFDAYASAVTIGRLPAVALDTILRTSPRTGRPGSIATVAPLTTVVQPVAGPPSAVGTEHLSRLL